MNRNSSKPEFTATCKPLITSIIPVKYDGEKAAPCVTEELEEKAVTCYYFMENNDLESDDVDFDVTEIPNAMGGGAICDDTCVILASDLTFKEQEHVNHPLEVCAIFDEIPAEADFIHVDADSDVNIDDIQLYLECSDDNVVVNDRLGNFRNNNMVAEATSQIKMDTQFKISFPSVPENSLKCLLCKKIFLSKDFLREHSMISHPSVFKFCKFCPYFTKSCKFFQTHMQSRHGHSHSLIPTPDISLPPANSRNITMKNNDLRDAPVDKRGEVKSIAQPGPNHDSMKLSGKNVTSTKGTTHGTKSDREKTKSNLEMDVKCELCNFITKSRRLLNYHKKTMHNESRTLYRCEQCDYSCLQKKSYISHRQKHAGLFEFPCIICEKKFPSKHLLTKHMRIHKRNSVELGKENSDRCRDSNSKEKNVSVSTQTGLSRRKNKKT